MALTQCPDYALCIPIRQTAFVQLPCTQTTKEDHGSRNGKEITRQGSARLDFLTMPLDRKHEQVLYAPVPHQNAEKLALSLQHSHAAILSRDKHNVPPQTN
jgi:hypothetical protein